MLLREMEELRGSGSKLRRSRAVAGPEPSSSSSDDKSDEESATGGSRIRLFRERRARAKSPTRSRGGGEKVESAIAQDVPREAEKKESGIARSIRRKFAFFRRSEAVKSRDVEVVEVDEGNGRREVGNQVVDVVADVHCGEEEEERREPARRDSRPESLIEASSMEDLVIKSLDLIEEFHEERMEEGESRSGRLSAAESVRSKEEEESEGSIAEMRREGNAPGMLAGESRRRRKRWDKSEIAAEDLVEDLKKPRRRQWAKEAAGAESRKLADNKKNVVAKRSGVAANAVGSARPRSVKVSTPRAAPRSQGRRRDRRHQAFDNEVFSSDQDEVLQIETINDSSPKIKMGNLNLEPTEDGASSSSDSVSRFEAAKEILPMTGDSDGTSESREDSLMASGESVDLAARKSPRGKSKGGSSSRRKSSADERSVSKAEEEDIEEEEDDQETVLNVVEKRSGRSSSSSKVEIIPRNFFARKSSDETTITTNEDMQTSRRGSSQRSRSRLRTRTDREQKRSGNRSGSSSRLKSKTTSSSTRNSTEDYATKRRRKAKRTRRKSVSARRTDELRNDAREEPERETKYTSVWIHRSDMIEPDYVTRHPMVKVHIVRQATGDYLRSRDARYLQPIITGKFDFKEKRSMLPIWEEELIFEQDFQDLLKEGREAALILFEIVDLLNYSEASACYDQFGRDACWFKVAWAFLRPVGISGVHHVDKKLRLQLYRPKKTLRKLPRNQCEAYRWWKSNSRNKYPGSLYVRLSAVEPPSLEPVIYEQPLHLEDVVECTGRVAEEPVKWSRPAAQPCRIPNESFAELEASENGCFHLAFSNDGKYLACALSEEYDYPILVYKVHDGSVHVRFSGHKSFVYSLGWSRDDRYLLSASSDRTARFWHVRDQLVEHIQSLPHPSYVYCAKFSMEALNYVVTGCYDKVARVWALLPTDDSEHYELVQELEVHESFVSSVCLQPSSETFFTGDGLGVIVAWFAKKSRRSPIRREWQIMRKIKIRELAGVPINTIILHPLGSRLVVHSRNNGLRLMDLRSGTVLRKFDGLSNQRVQITACVSPCGTLLFCGGEDATLSVWSLRSGRRLAVYEIGQDGEVVTCVDYHPNDHMLAFAVFGAPVPVKILKFEGEVEGGSVGLRHLVTGSEITPVMNSVSRLSSEPVAFRRGTESLELLPMAMSRSSSLSASHRESTRGGHEGNAAARVRSRGQTRVKADSSLRGKSLARLNGIIEKIDRILLYATGQKSPELDVESARDSSILTLAGRESLELVELGGEGERERGGREKPRKHRQRSRSARNSASSLRKEIEPSKALSESAAYSRKVSRLSDESSGSRRSASRCWKDRVLERLELDEVEGADSESGFKDSLGTIVDGNEDFTSEEMLDIESLKSDDTYVVGKEGKSRESGDDKMSDGSNATFIIESEIPVPKPRRKIGKVEAI